MLERQVTIGAFTHLRPTDPIDDGLHGGPGIKGATRRPAMASGHP